MPEYKWKQETILLNARPSLFMSLAVTVYTWTWQLTSSMSVQRHRYITMPEMNVTAARALDLSQTQWKHTTGLVSWLNVFNAELSRKRYWLGQRSQEVGGLWRLYLTLHCHHQNDSCIKKGSDMRCFEVFVNSEGQSHEAVSTDHNFWRERIAEAESNRGPSNSAYQPNALSLG